MKTKFPLPLSLCLNVILVATVGGLVLQKRQERPAVAGGEPKVAAEIRPPEQRFSQAGPAPEVRPFQWGDLASNDDATFARNLRAAGCPEGMIRSILAAAIADRFDQKRHNLAVAHEQGRLSDANLQVALAQSYQQQDKSVAQLSGGDSSSSPTVGAGVTSSSVNPVGSVAAAIIPGGSVPILPGGVANDPGIRSPLALTEPSASVGLTDEQRAAAYKISDNFSKTVAAQNLAPTDPAYHQLWKEAQADADDQLEAQIGWEAYQRWQIQTMWRK